jgi:hypothetical protein
MITRSQRIRDALGILAYLGCLAIPVLLTLGVFGHVSFGGIIGLGTACLALMGAGIALTHNNSTGSSG